MALSVKNMLGGSGGASPFAWGKYENKIIPTGDEVYVSWESSNNTLRDYYISTEINGNTLVNPTKLNIAYSSGNQTIPPKSYMALTNLVDSSSGVTITQTNYSAESGSYIFYFENGGTLTRFSMGTMYGFKILASEFGGGYKAMDFLEYLTDKNPLKYPNGEVADDGFFYRYANEGLYVWDKSLVGIDKEPTFKVTTTTNISTALYQSIVEYNGKFYGFTSSALVVSTDLTNFSVASSLPFGFSNGSTCIIVYDGEIHMLGGNINTADRTKHYSWNGERWLERSTLPFTFYAGGRAVVYHDEIHIVGGASQYSHAKWDGTEWTLLYDASSTPLPRNFMHRPLVVFDDKIVSLGYSNASGSGYDTSIYTYDGIEWKNLSKYVNATTPNGVAFATEDYIYDMSGFTTQFTRYDKSFTRETINITGLSDLIRGASLLVYDNKIHVMGCDNISPYTKHLIIGEFKSTLTLVDLIISDNENAYPSDGEMDGYYYKKTSTGLAPEMFGCSKIAVDKFVPATNASMSGVSISHSLGEIPKAVIIADTTSWDDYYASRNRYTIKLAFIPNFAGIASPNSGASSIAWFYYSSGSKVDYTYATGYWEMTSSTVKGVSSSTGFNTSAGYMANHEYTVITMA